MQYDIDELVNCNTKKSLKMIIENIISGFFLNFYNFCRFIVLYQFDDNAFYSRVYKAKVDRDLFSYGAKNDLLFMMKTFGARNQQMKSKL